MCPDDVSAVPAEEDDRPKPRLIPVATDGYLYVDSDDGGVCFKTAHKTEVLGSNLPAAISIRLFIDAPSPPPSLAWLRPVDQQPSIDMSLKGGAASVAYLSSGS